MVNKELSSAVGGSFSEIYGEINELIFSEGATVKSRVGDTKEILDFKTILREPTKRCVGGYERNTNVFFLLAEALWIWAGRKDVAFLTIFNSGMKEYSDDGKYFHAPYGFRLRSWGVHSSDTSNDSNKHAVQGLDQIAVSLKMLERNNADRRVVCAIWNPDFDLGTNSKDLPCNDTVMFKVRNERLCTTIANRSNDLHWGLTTNIFQFSFISEIMATILGIGVGTQVHNSQSLHVYTDKPEGNSLLTKYRMDCEFSLAGLHTSELYGNGGAGVENLRMDFNFSTVGVEQRLKEVDFWINGIITVLLKVSNNAEDTVEKDWLRGLEKFSKYLFVVYTLLFSYVRLRPNKELSIAFIDNAVPEYKRTDIVILAKAWMYKKLVAKGGDYPLDKELAKFYLEL